MLGTCSCKKHTRYKKRVQVSNRIQCKRKTYTTTILCGKWPSQRRIIELSNNCDARFTPLGMPNRGYLDNQRCRSRHQVESQKSSIFWHASYISRSASRLARLDSAVQTSVAIRTIVIAASVVTPFLAVPITATLDIHSRPEDSPIALVSISSGIQPTAAKRGKVHPIELVCHQHLYLSLPTQPLTAHHNSVFNTADLGIPSSTL